MYRILELLRRQEGFLSGEDIGRELSITRAAVWKGIKKLREEGYEIEAVTNRGYRLTNPETMYNKRELEQGLKTKTMGQSIYFYEETDTTNNRARELALEGAPEGTLVVAEKQTAGRGRRGKVWESPLGTGIWMSLVLRPQIMPAEASVLTLLCGLATAEAIEAETGLSAGIKWPNDILINGKKAVGILTEMDCEMSEVHFVIPGIGINVNTASFRRKLRRLPPVCIWNAVRPFPVAVWCIGCWNGWRSIMRPSCGQAVLLPCWRIIGNTASHWARKSMCWAESRFSLKL